MQRELSLVCRCTEQDPAAGYGGEFHKKNTKKEKEIRYS
jgi:hypothetical protein